MSNKKVSKKRLKPLIFQYSSDIILAERFWSELFLRAKPRKIKLLGNARNGQGERRNCCEGKIISKAYLRKMQGY